MATWSREVFANNLKNYLEKAGKTQKELSEIVGVSSATVNEWCKAKKYPRIDKIEIIADYFGIQKSDLIENKMTPEKEKDNDILADIIIRARVDKKFFTIIQSIYDLDAGQLDSVEQMLQALHAFNK